MAKYTIASTPIKGPNSQGLWVTSRGTKYIHRQKFIHGRSPPPPSPLFRQKKDRDIERREKREERERGWLGYAKEEEQEEGTAKWAPCFAFQDSQATCVWLEC